MLVAQRVPPDVAAQAEAIHARGGPLPPPPGVADPEAMAAKALAAAAGGGGGDGARGGGGGARGGGRGGGDGARALRGRCGPRVAGVRRRLVGQHSDLTLAAPPLPAALTPNHPPNP
jgi:hypothetical protein